MKFIILAGVLVVLMVAFGRNPIEKTREQRKSERQGDKLITAIEEHQKDPKNRRLGSGRLRSGNNAMLPSRQGSVATVPKYGPNGPSLPSRQPTTGPSLQTPGNSYYPPPPENTGNPNTLGAPNLGPRSDMQVLEDGRTLSFRGTKIYYEDEKGEKRLLEDGDYPYYGGKLTMYIRGGSRVLDLD